MDCFRYVSAALNCTDINTRMDTNYTLINTNFTHSKHEYMGRDKEIIYKELSYALVGCFYKVFNALGPGHKEAIYQNALSIEFDKQKIKFTAKKKIPLLYEGRKIGVYEPDFIIEDSTIVEIKSVSILLKVFEKQLFYYLKASEYRLGYLVNFGTEKIEIKRRVN